MKRDTEFISAVWLGSLAFSSSILFCEAGFFVKAILDQVDVIHH